MIPASYLFREIYRDHFERDGVSIVDHDRPTRVDGDRARLDRVTAAIVGFALGSPAYTLGTSDPHCRRR